MTQYWAVVHTHAKAEPDVRKGLEEIGFGAFLPNYAEHSVKRGRAGWRRKSLLTGYVLVSLDERPWRAVEDVEGVSRVLTSAWKPCRVLPEEMRRLMLGHASGLYNVIAPHRDRAGRYAKRRRRPRPGKKARAGLQAIAARRAG